MGYVDKLRKSAHSLKHWGDLPFFSDKESGFEQVCERLRKQPDVLPAADSTFEALRQCSPKKVRVVLLGKDPYPTPQHATGLAFSVPKETCPLPPTLRNISEEMRCDLRFNLNHGDLTSWAKQGVLLLNCSLTISRTIKSGEKHAIGWNCLIEDVFCRLRQRSDQANIFWVFWGKESWKQMPRGLDQKDQVLKTYHPVYSNHPDSQYNFFGSKPFSKINCFFKQRNLADINWQVPT